jgi:hypothetical protein
MAGNENSGRPKGSVNKQKMSLAEKLRENEDEFIEAVMLGVRKGDATCLKIYAAYAFGTPPITDPMPKEIESGSSNSNKIVIMLPEKQEYIDIKYEGDA